MVDLCVKSYYHGLYHFYSSFFYIGLKLLPPQPAVWGIGLRCWVAAIAGSNPTGDMDVCCECCVLSGKGLYDGPIPRPKEYCRGWCALSMISKPRSWGGLGPLRVSTNDKKKNLHLFLCEQIFLFLLSFATSLWCVCLIFFLSDSLHSTHVNLRVYQIGNRMLIERFAWGIDISKDIFLKYTSHRSISLGF